MHFKLHIQKSKIGGLLDLKVEIKLETVLSTKIKNIVPQNRFIPNHYANKHVMTSIFLWIWNPWLVTP